MKRPRIAFLGCGMVTPIGLTTAAAIAAMRANVRNPTRTRFMGRDGAWLLAHQVPLDIPVRGVTRLAELAHLAIQEAVDGVPARSLAEVPLFLCIASEPQPASPSAPRLARQIVDRIGFAFLSITIFDSGRIAALQALQQARELIGRSEAERVLIVAVDGLLEAATLARLHAADRLLTTSNSNGFVSGESAAAALVGAPVASDRRGWVCAGLGFGQEEAALSSGLPLRANGMQTAMKAALDEADCRMADISVRIGTMSGEEYWFREHDLAINRLLRGRHEPMELWHPAECIGETGAASGLVCAVRGVCRGEEGGDGHSLVSASNDDGRTAAMVLKRANP